MSDSRPATLCFCTRAEDSADFRRRLDRLLADTPASQVEIRLGLPLASPNLHYALGRLCADGAGLDYARLPGSVQRFSGGVSVERSFACWGLPPGLSLSAMLRWLWCDLPLTAEYVVWIEESISLTEDWWQPLSSAFQRGTDVFGPSVWSAFTPTELDVARLQPWYRGVPFPQREGRPGVWTLQGSPLAFRIACLRQADLFATWLPDSGAAFERVTLWLGAMAQQLSWQRAAAPASGQAEPSVE